jgi:hypothetical protein
MASFTVVLLASTAAAMRDPPGSHLQPFAAPS